MTDRNAHALALRILGLVVFLMAAMSFFSALGASSPEFVSSFGDRHYWEYLGRGTVLLAVSLVLLLKGGWLAARFVPVDGPSIELPVFGDDSMAPKMALGLAVTGVVFIVMGITKLLPGLLDQVISRWTVEHTRGEVTVVWGGKHLIVTELARVVLGGLMFLQSGSLARYWAHRVAARLSPAESVPDGPGASWESTAATWTALALGITGMVFLTQGLVKILHAFIWYGESLWLTKNLIEVLRTPFAADVLVMCAFPIVLGALLFFKSNALACYWAKRQGRGTAAADQRAQTHE